jgi:hypothetical protein
MFCRYRLRADHAAERQPTDLQRAKLLERGNALRRRIHAWQEIQQLYMPRVMRLRSLGDSDTVPQPYELPLLLPSAVMDKVSCDNLLLEHEWRLRYAQAHDYLEDLRNHLLLRTQLYRFKDRFAFGQRAGTRSHTAIAGLEAKIAADAARYRRQRAALLRLGPCLGYAGWETMLRPLEDTDLTGFGDGTEGRRILSWIWRVSSSGNATADSAGTV